MTVATARPGGVALVLAGASMAAAVAAWLGWSAWPVILVAFLTGLLAVAPRGGYLLALALNIAATFFAVLVALFLSSLWTVGILHTVAIVFGLIGLGFAALVSRINTTELRRDRRTWLELAGSLVGPVIWLGALALSVRVPLSERLGWLMRNDSMNNLILSHVILRDSGIVLGPNVNPVPLPAALIALGIIPGRAGASPESNLAHDLAGMGWTWAALIALFSALAGLTAAAIVRSAHGPGLASRAAAIGGSLLVLSWYATGYAVEFGFFNLDVALPVLLVSVLLATLADRSPLLAIGGLALASTLTLATWSPLVLVPLALLGVSVLRFRRQLWPRSGRGRAILILAGLQLLLYAAFGALPAFLSLGSALGSNGGIYAQNNAIVFAAGVVVLVLAPAAYRTRSWLMAVPVALVCGCWAALGALLFLNRTNATLWSYYPVKLAYFSTLLFIIVGFASVAALVARHSHRVSVRIGGIVVLTLAVAALMIFSPGSAGGAMRMNPIVRLVTSHPNDESVEQESLVLAGARRGQPSVVWNSGLSYESQADLWLLQLHDDTLSGKSKLRLAAYAQNQGDRSLRTLCEISHLVGPGLVVRTPDAQLPARFRAVCEGSTVTFAPLPTD